MTEPAFSAVIAAYNAAATLASSIRSVLAQTEPDFELIIIDDGSCDATADVAESFDNDLRIRVVNQQHRGVSAARNTGIERARGRYVGFLDSDDLWMPDYLKVMGGALEADPTAGFAYTDGWALDDERRRIRRATTMARQRPPIDPPREAEDLLRLLIWRNFIPSAALVRKTALEQVGYFDPGLSAAEDFELWLRLLANGWRAIRPPGMLFVRREHRASLSRDDLLMLRAHRDVWRRVAESHPAPPDVKVVAKRRTVWAENQIAIIEGRNVVGASVRRVRSRLGKLKLRMQGARRWRDRPPAEVVRAFPDLDEL